MQGIADRHRGWRPSGHGRRTGPRGCAADLGGKWGLGDEHVPPAKDRQQSNDVSAVLPGFWLGSVLLDFPASLGETAENTLGSFVG